MKFNGIMDKQMLGPNLTLKLYFSNLHIYFNPYISKKHCKIPFTTVGS
jgi:hypothetical protein